MSTLTKADMVDHLTVRLRMSRQDARFLVDMFFAQISQSLADGNFELRDKKTRPGRNPKTGEEVPVKARRVVTFKAGQKLRGEIQA